MTDFSDDDEGIVELEEGDLLELSARDPVVIKTVSFESEYKTLEELGKGKFGVVNKCKRKKDGKILAAKFVRKSPASKKEVTCEIKIMNLLHHKRLIQLYDAFETSKDMIVIMELVTGGELFEKVVEEDDLTEKQVIRYAKQVLFGIQHMHRKQMVHLDLKPENILCLGGGKPGYEEIKLIDFGMTRVLEEGKTETAMCGTPEFVAPEVITFNPITIAADMWSIGVVTYVLLSGLSPFMGDDDNETLKNVTLGEYDFEDEDEIFDHISDDVKKFIEELLVLDPKQRMTVEQSLEHTWLQKGGSEKKLNTSNLKKFIARRRWQRTMNAIKAVSRLAGGLSLFGKPSVSAHGLAKGTFLEQVKKQPALEDIEREKEDKERKEKEEAEKQAELKRLKKESERIRKEKEEKRKAEAEEKRLKLENDRILKEGKRKKKEEEEKLANKQAEEERQLREQAERKAKEKREKEKQERERKSKETAEAKRITEEDRKQKRENERKRRQEERKLKESNGKENEQTKSEINTAQVEITKPVELTISQKSDRLKERAERRRERREKIEKKNEKSKTDENQNAISNHVINKESTNFNGHLNNNLPTEAGKALRHTVSPRVARKTLSKPGEGSVKNRAAVFQQGDIFWKNK